MRIFVIRSKNLSQIIKIKCVRHYSTLNDVFDFTQYQMVTVLFVLALPQSTAVSFVTNG